MHQAQSTYRRKLFVLPFAVIVDFWHWPREVGQKILLLNWGLVSPSFRCFIKMKSVLD